VELMNKKPLQKRADCSDRYLIAFLRIVQPNKKATATARDTSRVMLSKYES
jgi:hypothetical protein